MATEFTNEDEDEEQSPEDMEWDEEALQASHLTKEEALELKNVLGIDYRKIRFVAEV